MNFGNIFNGVTSFLTHFLIPSLFFPGLFLAAVAYVFHPTGPTRASKPVVTVVAGTIALYVLSLSFRFGQTDALIIALIGLLIGLLWMVFSSGGWIIRIISLVVAFAVIGAIGATANAAPRGSVWASGVETVYSSVSTLWSSVTHG